jgi:hypothetical protein
VVPDNDIQPPRDSVEGFEFFKRIVTIDLEAYKSTLIRNDCVGM